MSYYLDLLERAVESLRKGETALPDQERPREHIELDEPALLPADYILDAQERLVIYQRMAQAKNQATLDNIAIELTDRFGRLPEAGKNLIERHKLRLTAAELGIAQLRISRHSIRLDFRADAHINGAAYLDEIRNHPQRYQLANPTSLTIKNLPETLADKLTHLHTFLERIRHKE